MDPQTVERLTAELQGLVRPPQPKNARRIAEILHALTEGGATTWLYRDHQPEHCFNTIAGRQFGLRRRGRAWTLWRWVEYQLIITAEVMGTSTTHRLTVPRKTGKALHTLSMAHCERNRTPESERLAAERRMLRTLGFFVEMFEEQGGRCA